MDHICDLEHKDAMAGAASMITALLANPLVLLGVILVLGAALGDIAERARIPWITGCIFAGVVLGPSATGVLDASTLTTLGGFLQASLALIAFNIGSQLVFTRLKTIGWSIAVLALAQLLAPFALVVIGETMAGMALTTAIVVAAVAPATAPTTTYAVINRLHATGPFVDRVLGVLAINDATTILIFSITSAAVLALLAAPGSTSGVGVAFLGAVANEALSVSVGSGLGLLYLAVRRTIEDGTPGWESRLTAMLLGLIVVSIGGAMALGLSHLLVPLTLGIVIANGIDDAERQRIHDLIRAFEEPLFIIFFVLAGANLPLSAAEHAVLLGAALIYMVGRGAGKYGAVFLTAAALHLDRPTRHYLGLCFPSQGALAMGLTLAFRSSPEVHDLPPLAHHAIETAVSIILLAVLVSQLIGPLVIDFAVRRGTRRDLGPPTKSRG
jgi:Kef-type K+ transport system membrane component KefB